MIFEELLKKKCGRLGRATMLMLCRHAHLFGGRLHFIFILHTFKLNKIVILNDFS